MDELFGTKSLYALMLLIGVFWFYRLYNTYKKKERSLDDYYDKLLKTEKYKVKGKFES